MSAIESYLDDGPTTCALIEIKSVEEIQLFQDSHLEQSQRLFELLEEFRAISENAAGALSLFTTISVTRWIFATNKLEQSGLSESDTKLVVEGEAAKIEPSQGKTEVTNMLDLVQAQYHSHTSLEQRLFDHIAVCRWHSDLFKDVLEPIDCGVFRKKMVFASGITPNLYLHHSVVSEAVLKLASTVFTLSKAIPRFSDKNKFAGIFGLSALSQFHFVDIHPFVDGNGRMCRYLSKRIIDEVCPLPFPMFDNRDIYIDSLVAGRHRPPGSAHHPLLTLLLDAAIEWYTFMLEHPFPDLPRTIIVSTLSNFDSRLNKFSIQDRDVLQYQFQQLEHYTLQQITLPSTGLEIGLWRIMDEEEQNQIFDDL